MQSDTGAVNKHCVFSQMKGHQRPLSSLVNPFRSCRISVVIITCPQARVDLRSAVIGGLHI